MNDAKYTVERTQRGLIVRGAVPLDELAALGAFATALGVDYADGVLGKALDVCMVLTNNALGDAWREEIATRRAGELTEHQARALDRPALEAAGVALLAPEVEFWDDPNDAGPDDKPTPVWTWFQQRHDEFVIDDEWDNRVAFVRWGLDGWYWLIEWEAEDGRSLTKSGKCGDPIIGATMAKAAWFAYTPHGWGRA